MTQAQPGSKRVLSSLYRGWTTSRLLRSGQKLAGRGAHDEALLRFRGAIKLRPGLAPAHLHAALALCRLERFDEAVQAADRGAELAPDNPAIHLFRGRVLYDAGQVTDAQSAFARASALSPLNDLAEGYVLLCQAVSLNDTEPLEKLAAGVLPDSTPFQARLLAAVESMLGSFSHANAAPSQPPPNTGGSPLAPLLTSDAPGRWTCFLH